MRPSSWKYAMYQVTRALSNTKLVRYLIKLILSGKKDLIDYEPILQPLKLSRMHIHYLDPPEPNKTTCLSFGELHNSQTHYSIHYSYKIELKSYFGLDLQGIERFQ